MARTISFTEARAHLSELMDSVAKRHEHLVITRNGRPEAVVLSAVDYEALQETLAVLDDGNALEGLRESEDDVAAGRVREWDDVKRELGLA
jgi:prevent-host-death family protein